jgi:hypothetical protein
MAKIPYISGMLQSFKDRKEAKDTSDYLDNTIVSESTNSIDKYSTRPTGSYTDPVTGIIPTYNPVPLPDDSHGIINSKVTTLSTNQGLGRNALTCSTTANTNGISFGAAFLSNSEDSIIPIGANRVSGAHNIHFGMDSGNATTTGTYSTQTFGRKVHFTDIESLKMELKYAEDRVLVLKNQIRLLPVEEKTERRKLTTKKE